MEQDYISRLEKIENILSKNNTEKDIWEKIKVITPFLLPILLAIFGNYYTNKYNANQLKIQKENDLSQQQLNESKLVNDFMLHLTTQNNIESQIAIEAIVYAAPRQGKQILQILSNTSDSLIQKEAKIALNNYTKNKNDLIDSVFSLQKQSRILAYNQIVNNWISDDDMPSLLINKAEKYLNNKSNPKIDIDNGLYNTIVTLNAYSTDHLNNHVQELKDFINKIPDENSKSKELAKEITNKLN